ncbi:MAG TPA: hypothetical protein VGA70_09425, partial [Longimicrobiales bacterium]
MRPPDRPELVLAFVCQEAGPDAEGRLDARGIYHDLFAPGFPARQERMVLVALLEWDRADHGRFQFRMDLVGEDGKEAVTLNGHTDVDARRADQPPARTQLIMPLDNVVFREPGAFRLRVRVKGRDLT